MTLNISAHHSSENSGLPVHARGDRDTRAGSATIDPGADRAFRIDGGMLGFDHLSLFHLSPLSDEPSEFRLLQSVEDPDVGFVVMSLKDKDFYLDHAPDARAGDASLDDIEIMNVVNIDKDSNGADFYVNLRAPLFFNRKSRVAKQVVLNDSKYPIRLKILK